MSSFSDFLRRSFAILAAMLALAAFTIRPAIGAPYDYTDDWYVPTESGWGVNLTQSDNFIFAAFYIYGPNGQPTWYSANMTWDGQSQFTGPLYVNTGTYFANAWNPNASGQAQVGVASFTPSTQNNYQGTLSYTVNGVGTITKAVTRFSLTPPLLAGNYIGGQSGSYSGCTSPASNKTYQDFFTAAVTQAGTSVTIQFSYSPGSLTCTLTGQTIQNGSILRIPNGNYQCSDGLNTNASVSDLRATPLGFEGAFTAPDVGGGCRETATFGGVVN
jgi:hypothetical protein